MKEWPTIPAFFRGITGMYMLGIVVGIGAGRWLPASVTNMAAVTCIAIFVGCLTYEKGHQRGSK